MTKKRVEWQICDEDIVSLFSSGLKKKLEILIGEHIALAFQQAAEDYGLSIDLTKDQPMFEFALDWVEGCGCNVSFRELVAKEMYIVDDDVDMEFLNTILQAADKWSAAKAKKEAA